jgi:regulator of replication initiation timing
MIENGQREVRMEKTIQELKVLIRELVLEVGDLKERVTNLEKTNSLEEPFNGFHSELQEEEVLKLQGEGYGQLGKLYRDGYHVCPPAFGTRRTAECLFCIAFMEKE